MRGITQIYPHPSDRPYPSQVPVAGEGVRIRPDTATWDAEMRDLPVDPGPLPRRPGGKNHGVRGSSVDPRPPGLAVRNGQGAGR